MTLEQNLQGIYLICHIFRNGFLKTLEKFSQDAVDEGYDGLDFLNALYGMSRECNTPDKHNYGDISHKKVEHIKQKGLDSGQQKFYRRTPK